MRRALVPPFHHASTALERASGVQKIRPRAETVKEVVEKTCHHLVDLIVQRATIELLAAHGIAAAPDPRPAMSSASRSPHEYAGIVRFCAPAFCGALRLSIGTDTLLQLRKASNHSCSTVDWMRELTTQLIGRIKNKVARYQSALRVELPTASSEKALALEFDQVQGTVLSYAFRTVKEPVLVWLRGRFDESALVFSGDAGQADEGDTILF